MKTFIVTGADLIRVLKSAPKPPAVTQVKTSGQGKALPNLSADVRAKKKPASK